jgi:hypothetical protein
MFASIKNNLKRGKYVKMLAFIVAGTLGEHKLAMLPEAEANVISASEPTFIESNSATKDANGNVAVRATAAGIAASQGAQEVAAAASSEPKQPKPVFTVEKGKTLPPIQRGGVKADIYPFGQMEVGDSFFVPATEKRPNPSKALASTVSSATKRFKGQTPARTFTVRAVKAGENGETANGARIWRTA